MLRNRSLPVVAWDGCVPPNLTEWCPEAVDRLALTVGAVLELSRVRMENGSTWIGFCSLGELAPGLSSFGTARHHERSIVKED